MDQMTPYCPIKNHILENEWFKYVGGIVELLWRLLQWSLKKGLFLGVEVGYWEICIMDL